MDTLFLVCAAFGGTILVVQTALMCIGIGGDELDADVGGDLPDGDLPDGDLPGSDAAQGSTAFFKLISFKAVVAFITFFGLVGMLGRALGLGSVIPVLMGVAAGFAAMLLIAWMMAGLAKLQSSGNYDLSDALGSEGRVALRVPPGRSGRGRVTVDFEGRRVECDALTEGGEIPTGTPIRVLSVRGPRTVEVGRLD